MTRGSAYKSPITLLISITLMTLNSLKVTTVVGCDCHWLQLLSSLSVIKNRESMVIKTLITYFLNCSSPTPSQVNQNFAPVLSYTSFPSSIYFLLSLLLYVQYTIYNQVLIPCSRNLLEVIKVSPRFMWL